MRGEPLKTQDEVTVANVFRLAVGARLLPQFPASPSVEQVIDGCAGYVERKLADEGDWTLLLRRAPPRERLALELARRLAGFDEGALPDYASPDHTGASEQASQPAPRERPEINRQPVAVSPATLGGGSAGESRRIVAAYQPTPPFEGLAKWKARLCALDVKRRDAKRANRTAKAHVDDEGREIDPLENFPDRKVPPGPEEGLRARGQEMEAAIAALSDDLDRAIAEVRWSQRRDLAAAETWKDARDRLAARGFEIGETAARQRLRRMVERAAQSDYLDEEHAAAEHEDLPAGHEDARAELIEAARARWRADRALRDSYKRATPLGALREHEKSAPPAEPPAVREGEESAAWLDWLAAADEVSHAVLIALIALPTLPTEERLIKVAEEIEECFRFRADEDQLRRRVRSVIAEAPEDLRRQVLALLD